MQRKPRDERGFLTSRDSVFTTRERGIQKKSDHLHRVAYRHTRGQIDVSFFDISQIQKFHRHVFQSLLEIVLLCGSQNT